MTENHTRIDLGRLHNMVKARLKRLTETDIDRLSQLLISYVLKTTLSGGVLNDAVMLETYETVNDIIGGGIIIPDTYYTVVGDE